MKTILFGGTENIRRNLKSRDLKDLNSCYFHEVLLFMLEYSLLKKNG